MRLIQDMVRRPACLGIIILATFISGAVIALLAYSFATTQVPLVQTTATASQCQIELTVAHDLYDEREDYWENGLPIGTLEAGIYGVIGISGDLVAVDWRGDIDVHPPTLALVDWIYPVEGINSLAGDCVQVQRFSPIVPPITSTP